tara:strand:+ start:269 stop:628 length:360 start_codon:yes stop_codon:yes gene_type:complete
MGYRHYEQMLEDALEVDCKAFITAMDIVKSKKSDVLHEDEPFDIVMERARKIDIMHSDFLSVMREKLANREVEVRMPTPSGKIVKVDDADVFDFDELRMPVEVFYEMMKHGCENLPSEN